MLIFEDGAEIDHPGPCSFHVISWGPEAQSMCHKITEVLKQTICIDLCDQIIFIFAGVIVCSIEKCLLYSILIMNLLFRCLLILLPVMLDCTIGSHVPILPMGPWVT